ncbi:MAG: hypothetical protein K2Y29_05025 [Beijerinckiaceae bacterium]|nr:hypothetical protein [Beijerinckiaceae bacterium]
MIELVLLAGVCILIGLMCRSVRERIIVCLIIGCVVAPLALLLSEVWHSEHSGPQMFLELFTYVGLYWQMFLALTAALLTGSLLVGLARRLVMKEVG